MCFCEGMVPIQQQQQQQQQGFPMVPVMQPNMQGMMGMNFGGQMPPGAMPIQVTMRICLNTLLRWICLIVCVFHFYLTFGDNIDPSSPGKPAGKVTVQC